jgi:hypothetical protein
LVTLAMAAGSPAVLAAEATDVVASSTPTTTNNAHKKETGRRDAAMAAH